jgi:hypothetical protein
MSEKKIADLLQGDNNNWWNNKIVANAPLIMLIFANLFIIAADIRAYDVLFRLTASWWKAAMAVIGGCALPFVIWEISWQYNHTTEAWRTVSLIMAGIAFATSLFLGIADYLGFQGEWSVVLLAGIIIVSGIHVVIGLLYYYNDPDVARRRHKAQALGTMQDQQLNAQVAEHLLEHGRGLLGLIERLEKEFDPEDVKAVLRILDGKKKNEPTRERPAKPQRQFANSTEAVGITHKVWTLDEFLREFGFTMNEAKTAVKKVQNPDELYNMWKGYGIEKIDISRKNFSKLFYELKGNPQTPPREK